MIKIHFSQHNHLLGRNEMSRIRKKVASVLSVLIVLLAVLVALFLLIIGAANLIHPDVSDDNLAQNTRVCVIYIITGLVVVYSIIRPFSGGILLCICAFSIYQFVNRNPVLYPVIFLGLLSILRSYTNIR